MEVSYCLKLKINEWKLSKYKKPNGRLFVNKLQCWTINYWKVNEFFTKKNNKKKVIQIKVFFCRYLMYNVINKFIGKNYYSRKVLKRM